MFKCLKYFLTSTQMNRVQQVTSKTKTIKKKQQKKGVGKSKQFVNDVKMKGNSN